jgi:hypothetical protein
MQIDQLPTYSVTTRQCSLQPERFRWLLISYDRAHKIHAPESFGTEQEAVAAGQIEAREMSDS